MLSNLRKGNADLIISELKERIDHENKTFLITVNSEILVKSQSDKSLNKILLDRANYLVVDGIATLTASRILGIKDIDKLPGVTIVENLLDYLNENGLKLATFGGSRESLDKFKDKINVKYPNIKYIVSENGYQDNPEELIQTFAIYKPDLILVALGVPAQEKIINSVLHAFDKGVFIGCGGSMDVIGGFKKRAPRCFIVTNTEWLYRIVKEPNRISRFVSSNFKLLFLVLFRSNDLKAGD